MFKIQLASLIVASAVIMTSTPKLVLAESQPRSPSHIQRHTDSSRSSRSKHDLRGRRERRHSSEHGHRDDRRKPTKRDNYRQHHRHRNHHAHKGIHRRKPHRPYHPHGHRMHIHDTYCPVAIHRHYVYATPTWTIWYQTQRATFPQASIHLSVAPHHGEVYIDGNFLGLARTFREGDMQVPVAPGPHTVQLRYGGSNYTRQIHVRPGTTTRVRADHL